MLLRKSKQPLSSVIIGPMIRTVDSAPVSKGCLLQILNLFYDGNGKVGFYHPTFQATLLASPIASLNDLFLRPNQIPQSSIRMIVERLATLLILKPDVIDSLVRKHFKHVSWSTLSLFSFHSTDPTQLKVALAPLFSFLDMTDTYILEHFSDAQLLSFNIQRDPPVEVLTSASIGELCYTRMATVPKEVLTV